MEPIYDSIVTWSCTNARNSYGTGGGILSALTDSHVPEPRVHLDPSQTPPETNILQACLLFQIFPTPAIFLAPNNTSNPKEGRNTGHGPRDDSFALRPMTSIGRQKYVWRDDEKAKSTKVKFTIVSFRAALPILDPARCTSSSILALFRCQRAS